MRNVATNVPPPVPDRFGEIAVMIVDDHEVVRRGIAEVIDRSEGMSVVAEAGSVAEGIRRATLVRPQVVLVDLQLPDGTGIDVILALREQLPEARSVVLTSFDDDDALAAALDAGAAAYLLKSVRGAVIVRSSSRVRPAASTAPGGTSHPTSRRSWCRGRAVTGCRSSTASSTRSPGSSSLDGRGASSSSIASSITPRTTTPIATSPIAFRRLCRMRRAGPGWVSALWASG